MAKRPLTPHARQKLAAILNWNREDQHPFTKCKRALIREGHSPESADKICAAMKDHALGTTKWRKGNK